MARSSIPFSEQRALLLCSGNQCAFPNCTEPMYNMAKKLVLGQMAHIRAISPGGARYDVNYPKEKINTFENLIFLCPNHHSEIDKDEPNYSTEKVLEIKEVHERNFDELSRQSYDTVTEGEINSSQDVLLNAINDLLSQLNLDSPIPEKKVFPHVTNYIERRVTPIRNEDKLYDTEVTSLIDLLKVESRIVLLGVGGFGKTIELDHLAHFYSTQEGFYPIKIRLNLLSNQSIEEFVKLDCPDFENVPENELLVILDALDEVHTGFFDIACRNIALFSQKFKKAKVVVTCRNNFYITDSAAGTGKIQGFKTYLLNPITYYAVHQFLDFKLNGRKKDFLKKIDEKKLFELLLSPFFLISLVDHYLQKSDIPKTKKEIFDSLIYQRINKDFEKYSTAGVSLQKYRKMIEAEMEKLAIAAECLGRNYLRESDEVFELISNTDVLKIIEHTFLFNKAGDNTWQFEHNNFQEFFAAKYLAKQDFDQIKKFLSFEPDYQKIKPSWLNTLSFLFGILEESDPKHKLVLEWIVSIEPDVLIRFEKDKISLSLRENIFSSIYQKYHDRGIIVRNEKFESEDLARFVSDSVRTLEMLIENVENTSDRLVILESIRLFQYFDMHQQYRNRIEKAIMAKLKSDIFSSETKYYCIRTLCDLDIYSEELENVVLEIDDVQSDQYTRSGLYRYLLKSNRYSQYTDKLLEGISHIERPTVRINSRGGESDHQLADEKWGLEDIFKKIDNQEQLKSILKWAANYENPSHGEHFFFDVLKLIMERISKLSNGADFFDNILSLLKSFSRRYFRELKREFREYFISTNTSLIATEKLLEECFNDPKKFSDYNYTIAVICDRKSIDLVLEHIKSSKLQDLQLNQVRNMIAFEGEKELNEYLYEGLLKIDKAKYEYVQIDHEQNRKMRLDRDRELLLSSEEFIKEAEKIFADENRLNEDITFEELTDYRKKSFEDENLSNNIVIEYLRRYAADFKSVNLVRLREIVLNEETWIWYKLKKFIKFDTNDINFEFNENEVIFLTDWVNRSIKNCDFETALRFEDGTFHFRFLEPYVLYFVRRLNIKVENDVYLGFLHLAWHQLLYSKQYPKSKTEKSVEELLAEFVVEKVGFSTFKSAVLANIKSDTLIPATKLSHFSYCEKYQIVESIDEIYSEIIGSNFKEYEKREAVDFYFNLNGNHERIEKRLGEFDRELEMHVIDKLIDKPSVFVETYCINRLSSEEDKGIALTYILKLIKMKSYSAISCLKDWVLKYNELPDRMYRLEGLKEEQLDDLIVIFDHSLKMKLGEGLKDERHDYLEAIMQVGCLSTIAYNKVTEQMNAWINQYSSQKYLYYQIQKLEQLYYSKRSQVLSIDQIKQLVSPLAIA